MDVQSDPSYGNDQPKDDTPPYIIGQGHQPPQQAVVICQPTLMILPTPLVNPPSDGLVFSIFVTFCCCLPLGIFALVRSGQCRAAIKLGDRAEAKRLSRESNTISCIGCVIGVIVIISYAVLMFVRANGNT